MIVESAIVLPLFVFLLLAIIQLGLLHQARLLTKYAAYKAVRAGALRNASVPAMEQAALGVLLPLLSYELAGTERITPVWNPRRPSDPRPYERKWESERFNRMRDSGMRFVEVDICGPTRNRMGGEPELDFDAPGIGEGVDQSSSDRTKLRIRVTFNYRMPIPFANAFLHAITWGKETTAVLRIGRRDPDFPLRVDRYSQLADRGVYVVPVRASYAMRMQSNPYHDNLPEHDGKCLPDD